VSAVASMARTFALAVRFDGALGWCVAESVDRAGAFEGAACEARACGVVVRRDCEFCGANERVEGHACVACPAGATNAAGDDASAGDTTCDAPAEEETAGDAPAVRAIFGVGVVVFAAAAYQRTTRRPARARR